MKKAIDNLPFHIGYLEEPVNPSGLPDTLDFHYSLDKESGLVKQELDQSTLEALSLVYSLGLEIGTPLSMDELGAPYLLDYANFILNRTLPEDRILEIGVGRGHLCHHLSINNRKMVGIEPGKGYSKEWVDLGISVVSDFFPSDSLTGKFNAIVSFAVLEHVLDPLDFLKSMASQLKPFGKIILAVPDCSAEIFDRDASMFIHEHVSYFSKSSLEGLIYSAGLEGTVHRSGFGRSLYAVAQLPHQDSTTSSRKITHSRSGDGDREFLTQIQDGIDLKKNFIQDLCKAGIVGIFAPVRALPYLSSKENEYRFFDDDYRVHGKFLVPFTSPVESRVGLMNRPVDILVIASRTFGYKIKEELIAAGYVGRIELLWDSLTEEL